jgi:hypothetical protein
MRKSTRSIRAGDKVAREITKVRLGDQAPVFTRTIRAGDKVARETTKVRLGDQAPVFGR